MRPDSVRAHDHDDCMTPGTKDGPGVDAVKLLRPCHESETRGGNYRYMRLIFVLLAVATIVVSAIFLRPTAWFFVALFVGLSVVGVMFEGRHGSPDVNGVDKPEVW